jgi:hypothetical protein
MTKTKLWVIGALVRQRLVLPFCPPLLSLLVLVSCLSGNFENENVRKTGLLNAFLLLSSSFLLFCEWFVPVLLVFYLSSVLPQYVSVRLLFAVAEGMKELCLPFPLLQPALVFPEVFYCSSSPSISPCSRLRS